ncbi:MAG: response regulator [Deltaproteobacteria bacterium]|nr:response regulator [Deltaproteobacteria bacterium]
MTHRILIVEDDKHFAGQLKELFDYHGLHARVAVTGPEGIEAFGNGGADFLMIDVMLPQVHGIKVLEQIRGLPGGADVPAILMSAVYKNASLFKPDMSRLGVHAFLPKPFSIIDVGRKVNGILAEPEAGRLSVRSLLQDAAQAPAAVPRTPSTAKGPPSPPRVFENVATEPAVASVPDPPYAPPSSLASGSTRGDLSRSRYARLITHLFHSHASGVLRLRSAAEELTLYLLNGYPVWAETGTATAMLSWLVSEGVVERPKVAHLEPLNTAPEVRAQLLSGGIVSADDMPPLMEGWVAWQVRHTLDAAAGTFEFEKTDEFAGMIPVYEVNPIRELWQALRAVPVSELEPDLAVIASREIGRTRSFNRLFGYVANTSELRELGEHLLRPRKLAEVRERFRDANSTRCLWILVSAGLVAVADAPHTSKASPKPKKRPPLARPTGRVSSRGPAPAVSDERKRTPSAERRPRVPTGERLPPSQETRRYGRDMVDKLRTAAPEPRGQDDTPEARVARDYVTRMELDHYAFLGVERHASAQAIDSAYQDLAPRYRLRNLGTEMHSDTRRQAKELLTKLVEAFGELSDPRLRRRYDEALLASQAAGRKPPRAMTNPGRAAPAAAEGPMIGYPSAESHQRLAELGRAVGHDAVKTWQQARRAMKSAEWRRAMSLLESLRVDLPSEPGLLADMAWCRFNSGIPTDARTQDKSLEWVELAVAFQPGHPDVVEVKARILCFSDAHAEALAALQRLERIGSTLPWIKSQRRRHTERVEAASENGGMLSGLFGRGRGKK